MRRFEELRILANATPDERSFKYLIQVISQGIGNFNKYDGITLDYCQARSSNISDMRNILLLEHLQIPHSFPDPRGLVLTGAQIAVSYFFGDWRKAYSCFGETLDEARCRAELPWVDQFRYGLLLALVVDQLEIAKKLSSYLDAAVAVTDDDEDGEYWILLAHLILGEPSAKYPELRAEIERGRRKRPKLLLKASLAWEQRDSVEFRKALVDVMKHFAGKEFDPERITRWASIDGSILWNLARLSGLQFEPLPEELMDFVITDKAFDHHTEPPER